MTDSQRKISSIDQNLLLFHFIVRCFVFIFEFTSRNRVCTTPIGMASLSYMWTRSCVKSNRVNVKTPNIAKMLLAADHGLFAFFIHWKFHWEHLPALLIHINISANIIQFLGNPMFVLFFSLKHAIINTIFSCTWFQFLWFSFLFCYNFFFFFQIACLKRNFSFAHTCHFRYSLFDEVVDQWNCKWI